MSPNETLDKASVQKTSSLVQDGVATAVVRTPERGGSDRVGVLRGDLHASLGFSPCYVLQGRASLGLCFLI